MFGQSVGPLSRKRHIEESDDTLVAQHDEASSPLARVRDKTKSIGVRDTSQANDFGTEEIQSSHATLVSDPTVISDAGNQQFKEFKAQAREVKDSNIKTITDVSPSTSLCQPTLSSTRRLGRMPQPTRMFELQQNLRNACQIIKNPMHHGHQKTFLPRGELERLINEDSVTKELIARGFEEDYAHNTAIQVCQETRVPGEKKKKIQSYQQIFAILVFMDQPCSIVYFMEDNVSDLDLPIDEYKDPDTNSLRRRHSPSVPLLCALQWHQDGCTHWSPEQKTRFCELQWLMMASFFSLKSSNKVSHYSLEEQRLLPFINGREILAKKPCQHDDEQVVDLEEIESGFSKVFMVWVHPQHHDLDRHECDRGFAIKQLMKPSEDDFNQEVEMLKKFIGDRSHPHIVSLLATYKQYGKYHMIFHRADGNLFEYWRHIRPAPTLDYDTVKWVAKQLAGLSGGLLRFHKHTSFPKCCEEPVQPDVNEDRRPKSQSQSNKRARFEVTGQEVTRPKTKYGRHGDMKPENILWFPDSNDPDGGVLKISDLGQAQLHSTISKTRRESNGIHTLTYRPPESDIEPYLIRQSGDIWSFGCIILEFITWALGSWVLVEEFKTKRASEDQYSPIKSDTFYELKQVPNLQHSGAQIKPVVTQVGSCISGLFFPVTNLAE
ncbi:hypothetical protein ACHAP8_007556 [Fusarium lateritium]